MSHPIRIHLAQTKVEFEEALSLLKDSRAIFEKENCRNGIWLLKQHALPSTNIIVASMQNKVIGAICLFGENPFQLPIEKKVDLTAFKENTEGRIAEISTPAIKPEFEDHLDLLLALYQFTVTFGSDYCHYDSFVTQTTEMWAEKFARLLQYQPLPVTEKIKGIALYLRPREGSDYRNQFSPNFSADFAFPEKKFFLVAHQNMSAEVIQYLFNEKTHLFKELTESELRIFKNIYDYGDFANVLPKLEETKKFLQLPKHRRFAMNCDGYLHGKSGEKIHMLASDVSRQGLKIKADEILKKGEIYALQLSIGVMKQTEVIAEVVWCNPDEGTAGLQVKNGDKNWNALIEYLEKGLVKKAA